LSWRANLAARLNRVLRPLDIQVVRGVDVWRPLTQLGRQPDPGPYSSPFSPPFLKSFQGSKLDSLQQPADFAVVMPTTLRKTIGDAIQSVFDQRFPGSVQLLLGIDASIGEMPPLEEIFRRVPDRHSVLVLYPGYSTSRRHGGLHFARDGGSLRTILSYLANSRYVAYLDDDNWWSDDHLSSMHAVLSGGSDWAYALRWYVHPRSRRPICKDEWESIGPGKGFFRETGGWVDPNCLAIDKLACEGVLRWWSIPQRNSALAMDADRVVFRLLRTQYRGAGTGRHTVYYEISEADQFLHASRLSVIGAERFSASAAEIL
jgi:hypothetical protein